MSSISTATRVKYGLRPVCFAEFNRASNAAKLQMDKKGISYKTKDNAFIQVEDPDQLQNIVKELNGKAIMDRAEHWKNIFFKFDKGKYSTRSKYLEHQWYASQVEVSSNVVFKSGRFATSLFERILDKFQRPRPTRLENSHNGSPF